MKKDMPLEGLRWSRDSGSALYDTPPNGRSRTGWEGDKWGVLGVMMEEWERIRLAVFLSDFPILSINQYSRESLRGINIFCRRNPSGRYSAPVRCSPPGNLRGAGGYIPKSDRTPSA